MYRKTSVISPVESRVLTMLSPSLPPGRCCTWTVMSGFLAWKASARPSAGLTLPSALSTRKVSVVAPPRRRWSPGSRRCRRRGPGCRPPWRRGAGPAASLANLMSDLLGSGLRQVVAARAAGGGPAGHAGPCGPWPGRAGEGEGVDQPARRRVEERLEPGRGLRLVADHAGLHGGGHHLPPGVLVVEDVADGRLGPQRAVGRRRVGGLPGVGAVADPHRLRPPGTCTVATAPTGTTTRSRSRPSDRRQATSASP